MAFVLRWSEREGGAEVGRREDEQIQRRERNEKAT